MGLTNLLEDAKRFEIHNLDLSRPRRYKLNFLKDMTDEDNINNTVFTDGILREMFDKSTTPEERRKILKEIKKQFYIFLCTDNESFAEAREQLGDGFTALVPIIAGIIATQMASVVGIPVAVITAIVAGLLYLTATMTKKVWCNINTELAPA